MPFMEYAGSYALYNYRLEDPSKGMEYDNIRLIRAFEHGLDPKSSVSITIHFAPTTEGVGGGAVAGQKQEDTDLLTRTNRRRDSSSFTSTWSKTLGPSSLVSSRPCKPLMKAEKLPTTPCGRCSVR